MSIRVEGKQKRAVLTRQKILDAYEKLSRVRLFEDISVAEIARVAGVGKGTVLAHFSEKLALPAALFARALDNISDEILAGSSDHLDLEEVLIQLLNFTFTDDVYARILLWEGHDVCEAIIGPSEERLFAVLSEKLPQSERMSVEMQFDVIRALLVNAVVMNRACKSEDDTRAQFRDLLNVTLGNIAPKLAHE